MVNLTINDIALKAEEGTTILAAAQSVGITIPTLCFLESVEDAIGACRVCCVEVEGSDRLVSACNYPVEEGMVVTTNSPRAEAARKTNLELILSRHDLHCSTCNRNQTCLLQKLLLEYDLIEEGDIEKPSALPKTLRSGKRAAWDESCILQRDVNKCIQCGRCVLTCDRTQNIGVWEFAGAGAQSNIGVVGNTTPREAGCVACGQCITHCPDAALTERDDTQMLFDAMADPEITTVIQIAPATRSAWASSFGLPDGELGVERMAAALKAMGADYVFDTVFSADLTIMEEGTELLNIIKNGETERLPLFTSCCPGWVAHANNKWPQFTSHLSSAKSPMMMFGSVVKTWFAQKKGLDPAKIFSVALMPCTAKKAEIHNESGFSNPGIADMDCSLTTREFARMIKQSGIDVAALEDVPLDNPLDEGTGAGVIFGTTGGVMEAALRTADYVLTGTNKEDPEDFVFSPAKEGPWKEATFNMGGVDVHCAVAHSLSNADAMLQAIDEGVVKYDFVEVMACPTGCAGGGGQPIDGSDREMGFERGEVLRDIDRNVTPLRFSHENPVVQTLYEEWLGEPNSELAEQYLHTHNHNGR